MLIMVGVAALIWFGWAQWQARKAAEQRAANAENSLGLSASRVVFISFERAADLRVGTIRGKVAAQGGYDGTVFHPRQVTTAPVTVDYFLPLSAMKQNAYRWNAETKTLTIDAPDVKIGVPNVDMANAVTTQAGVYISRQAGLQMARQAAQRISARTTAAAKTAKKLNNARESGRTTLARMAEQTLSSVGVDGAKVVVSFPWEPKTVRPATEQWDKSRSVGEVLNDGR